jgi:hypothetical protein
MSKGVDFGIGFDNISRQMQLDFDIIRSEVPHSGEKGKSFEQKFREFLEIYSELNQLK